MDDVKLMKELDFASFEEAFKLGPNPVSNNANRSASKSNEPDGGDNASSAKKPSAPALDTLLEHTRLKNMAICRRKLPAGLPTSDLIRGVNALDVSAVGGQETVELLMRMVPTEAEIKAYREYNARRGDPERLTEEDRLMRLLACVERLSAKLQIMIFMATFEESVRSVRPQLAAIVAASKTLRNSARLKKVLELILAFGNYMNSTKKGPCYGFRLHSLDSLTITKAGDRKRHLVHYLAELLRRQFPDLCGFTADLACAERAAQFSLENALADAKELQRGADAAGRELAARLAAPNADDKRAQNDALAAFVSRASEAAGQVGTEADRAASAFADCAAFFGESEAKPADAATFFGCFARFADVWRKSEAENEKRRKAEEAAAAAAVVEAARTNATNLRRSLQNELEVKLRSQRHQQQSKKPQEVSDGTLEDIILGLKSEPYRANLDGTVGVPAGGANASGAASRRSFRRQRSERVSVTAESEAL